jgi:amidase
MDHLGPMARSAIDAAAMLGAIAGVDSDDPTDPARRTSAGTEARLRFTAPFDMSRHPTLTLPGGQTAEGLPVGFQIVGRHMEEALLLRAGHAFQQATEWHRRRPSVEQ